MDLYPAIDLRDGRCVRLVEGDFEQETVYGDDPDAVARSFAAAGARWVHVVDLDAALTGDPVNRGAISRIASLLAPLGVRVQTGGGVRSYDDIAVLLDAGVSRVVIGTAAVENPALVSSAAEKWPGQIAVGLDHRQGVVRVRGWADEGGRSVDELVPWAMAAGAAAIIVTDISRDGRLAGPDVAGLRDLLLSTGAPLIASGGVRDLADVQELASLGGAGGGGGGLIGAIAGKAIYEGGLDLGETVAWLSAESSR